MKKWGLNTVERRLLNIFFFSQRENSLHSQQYNVQSISPGRDVKYLYLPAEMSHQFLSFLRPSECAHRANCECSLQAVYTCQLHLLLPMETLILPCLLWTIHAVFHMWLLHCKKCCLCGSVRIVPAAHTSQGPTSLCLSWHSKSRPSPSSCKSKEGEMPMTAAWEEKRQGLWMIIYLLGCRHTFLWTEAVSAHSSMGRAFPPVLTQAQKAVAICLWGKKSPALPQLIASCV